MFAPASRRALLAGTCMLASHALGFAQTTPAHPPEPRLGQSGKDVMWLPSPDAVVERMLQMADVRPGDLVVDLGSGDGKIPIAAARSYGVRALGLEYDPKMVEVSVYRAREAGVADKAEFRQVDIFVADFSQATVVTMYLLPELNLRLRPALFAMKPGTRVVSNAWDMGDWQADEVARLGTSRISFWRVPANASGDWGVTVRGLPGAPHRLALQQRFQQLRGEALFGRLAAGLVRPQLVGDAISFSARPARGELLHFRGRVSGDRMSGTVMPEGRAPQPFEAVRTGPAKPIEGIAATEREVQRAHQELGAGT